MDPKERRFRERWHLYDAAIKAGRFAARPNFPELAPLTIRERALVLKFLVMEKRQGSILETPRETEIRERESQATTMAEETTTTTTEGDAPGGSDGETTH